MGFIGEPHETSFITIVWRTFDLRDLILPSVQQPENTVDPWVLFGKTFWGLDTSRVDLRKTNG